MKHLNSKWGQDGWRVFLTVEFLDCDKPNTVVLTDSEITVGNEEYSLAIPLAKPVDKANSSYVERGKSVSITLRKRQKIHWETLSTKKIPNLGIDWNRWVDEDDDVFTSQMYPGVSTTTDQNDIEDFARKVPTEALSDAGLQKHLMNSIRFEPKDSQPLESAPDLSVDSVDGWVSFWVDTMTLPQRMYMMVETWNLLSVEERESLMRYLITFLDAESPEASAHVKGGEGVLRDLDPSHYKDAGATLCSRWIEQMKNFDVTPRLDVVKIMFQNLTAFDRKLVISAFM
eukprot:GHVN01069283.1.p1 GENE.GHVN01069283.1~~GHVN01069283.1.p1  ORF type:complete len:286 (+),score=34.17 GHVN01069283.1:85-942(+)